MVPSGRRSCASARPAARPRSAPAARSVSEEAGLVRVAPDGFFGWRTVPGSSYTRKPLRLTCARDSRRSRLVAKDTLTITDNRTGKSYEVPIEDGTIKATDLRQIKVTTTSSG